MVAATDFDNPNREDHDEMSTTTDVEHVPAQAAAVDDPFTRRMRRLATQSAALARSSLLPYSLTHTKGKPRDHESVKADVMAIALTADSLGIQPSINMFAQFAVIQGQVVPSTQLLTGLAWRAGCEVWLEDVDDTKAIAHLTRQGSTREHVVEYTVEMARASGALDFWYEGWSGDDKRKEVVGQDLATASAAKAPTWAKGGLKSNPAWHSYRADMLSWRALRRVLKRGAPDISAGLIGLGDSPVVGYTDGPAGPTPVVDRDPDTGQLVNDEEITDAEIVTAGEGGSDDPGPTGAASSPSPSSPTEDQGRGDPGMSAAGTPAPSRKNPYAEAAHIAASKAGISDTVLRAIVEGVTGDPSANSITRATCPTVVNLVWEASEVDRPGDDA